MPVGMLCPLGGLVEKPRGHLRVARDGVTWEKLTLVVDSGASDTVLPPELLSWIELAQNGKKLGAEYEVANGTSVFNIGERQCIMRLSETSKDELEIVFQVVEDVQKPLLAVSAIIRQGHQVIFSDKPHVLLSSGEKIPLRVENGTYELDIWIKKPGFTRQSRAR